MSSQPSFGTGDDDDVKPDDGSSIAAAKEDDDDDGSAISPVPACHSSQIQVHLEQLKAELFLVLIDKPYDRPFDV